MDEWKSSSSSEIERGRKRRTELKRGIGDLFVFDFLNIIIFLIFNDYYLSQWLL